MARKPLRIMAHKLLRVGWREHWALVKATGLLLTARAALRLLPLRPVLEFASSPSQTAKRSLSSAKGTGLAMDQIPTDANLQRLIWGVDVVGRWLFPKNPCLTQAIVVQHLLRRRGHPSELKIGVRMMGTATLQAHAWVVDNGSIIIGARGHDPEYLPFPEILPTPPVTPLS